MLTLLLRVNIVCISGGNELLRARRFDLKRGGGAICRVGGSICRATLVLAFPLVTEWMLRAVGNSLKRKGESRLLTSSLGASVFALLREIAVLIALLRATTRDESAAKE